MLAILFCPSSYDLGEEAKVVLLCVTEGEDKPLKYPSIFAKSELLVLTKIDLLPYVPFRVEEAYANARLVHPGIKPEKDSTNGCRGQRNCASSSPSVSAQCGR
jgi:hydrogenase nickel incorporation protein HypB